MRTGEQRQDHESGARVVVLADDRDTAGAYALAEVLLPGGARLTVAAPDPLPRVELEVLHGRLLVDGRPLGPGAQLTPEPGTPAEWLVPPGAPAVLMLEIRPGTHLRAVVQMLLAPH